MRLPTLTETSKSKDINDAFAGYNHNLIIGNGEFYDMMGMTSEYYPVLSPKKHKKLERQNLRSGAMIFHDGLIYTDGTKLNVYGTEIELGLATDDVSLHQQRLIEFGSYILVFPDKKYINTATLGTPYVEKGNIDVFHDSWADWYTNYPFTFTPCDKNGNTSNPDGFVMLGLPNIYDINVGDSINISIDRYAGMYKDEEGELFNNSQLDAIEGPFIVENRTSGDYARLIIRAELDESVTITNKVTYKRSMPIMDYVFESNNRLWGCRYGENDDGENVNEIYASALGDFRNWSRFQGISTDSYAVSIGTNGPWTGAINYRGIPCFFKQNHVHMVYGDYPAQYQISEMTLDGVDSPADSKSLAIVDGILFYKSKFGFMAFNGSTAEKLSDVFGDVRLGGAVAGEIDGQYFVCAGETTNGANEEFKGRFIFVYDTKLGVWMKRSKENVIQFCRVGDSLFSLTELEGDYDPLDPEAEDARTNTMWVEHCKRTVSNEKVEWFTESGKIGMYLTAKKYISRIAVRLSLAIGSLVRIYIQYDSDGKWNPVLSVRGTSMKSFYLPIRPHRCDHFRIRIEGIGEAKIYSIDKTIEEGSEH